MNLFDFPAELRLKIYSELLVLPEPIVFVADSGSPSPLFLSRRYNLWPALLRVNKKVHDEAISLLYSDNCFQFPDIFIRIGFGRGGTYGAHMTPFLREIGSQTNLIRRIRMNFPTFEDYSSGTARLHEARIKNLELIRETCASITTLELSLNSCLLNFTDGALDQALDLLDAHLQTISSLKKIVIKAEVIDYDDFSDDLERKMRDCGWTVEVTKLEIPKQAWADDERGIEFDLEEDYLEHMNEMYQQEEEERRLDEYHTTRNDPYWKNESDYD